VANSGAAAWSARQAMLGGLGFSFIASSDGAREIYMLTPQFGWELNPINLALFKHRAITGSFAAKTYD